MWRYRLYKKLFGWDYIAYNYHGYQRECHIARLIKLPNMQVGFIFKRGSNSEFKVIKDPKEVVWLTCHPELYLFESEKIINQ